MAFIDWEKVEPLWRAGIKTKLELSEEFKVSRAAMDKHFKKKGINRDLKPKIKASADEKVTSYTVAKALVAKGRNVTTRQVTQRVDVTEAEIIEVHAEAQAIIRNAHRADIQRARRLLMMMMDELEMLTDENRELFQQVAELMAATDDRGVDRLNDLYRKVISLPSRTDSMKKVSETMKLLITMEREAFGIESEDPLEKAARTIAAALNPADAYARMINGG